MIHLELARLGVVRGAGGAAAPLAPRDALLLAWLAIEGPTRRARMAALLWPDTADDAARNALRQRVFQLRRRFGSALLVDEALLALAPAVVHDLRDDGPLLDGVQAEPGGELQQWLAAQRAARLDRRQRALAMQADAAEAARDWAQALATAQQLLALAPLSEEVHRRLMRLHYLAGDRAAALLAFDRCEAMLKHEVGAAPAQETLALLRLVSDADGAARLPAERAPALAALQHPPRLVGRDDVRAALLRGVQEGRLAVLAGEAGIGKSRLLADLVERCHAQGLTVLAVGARPGDALLPHALAARWLQALLALPGLQPQADERTELARLLPTLGAASPVRDDRGEALRQVLAAVLRRACAGGLAAVIVDDLQFADRASLTLLQPLLAAGDGAWVLALRPHELEPATREWIETLQRTTVGLPRVLPPLGTDDVAVLVESLAMPGLAGRAQADGLVRHTGGNPLFVLETLRAALSGQSGDAAGRWPAVASVQHLIRQRLERLSPMALKLARCAAIAGPDLSADLAAAVLGVRPLDLADVWAELEAGDVLRGGGFAHDLIGEAARAAVPEPVARSLHAEIARWMEAHAGAPARIARHWLTAGEAGRAVPHLLQAARQAEAAWQGEVAAVLWEEAAARMREAGDRRGAFDALIRASHALSEVVVDARLERFADELAELADDDGQQATAALVRLVMLVEARRMDDALQLAVDALARARRAGRADVEVELLWDLTAIHFDRGDLLEAAGCAEAALRRLGQVDRATAFMDLEPTRVKLQHALGTILSMLGRFAEGNAHIEQAYAAARRDGQAQTAAFEAASLADNALALGDVAAAQRHSAEALAEARAPAAGAATLARVLKTHGEVLALAGDLGGALRALDEAAEASANGTQRYAILVRRARCWLHHELGRRDLALKGLRELRAAADLPPADRLMLDALLLHLGEPGDAAQMLDRLSALDQLGLRARALCLVEPACDPERVLPLLTLTASAARERGAHGLWVDLQAHRLASLRALGRDAEAREAAQALWPRLASGLCGCEPFPHAARGLVLVWNGVDDELAQEIAWRASAWMRRAAANLPVAWRENYLARAPSLPSGWCPGRRLGAPEGRQGAGGR